MTQFTVIRHGQTDWNLKLRIQGTTDIPLNDTGREQAKETAIRIQGERWDRVVSSHLGRAVETASIIAEHLDLAAPLAFKGLGERSYGDAEGMNSAELAEAFGDMGNVPEIERRGAVAGRVLPVLNDLSEEYPGERILVVTHGGVIGSLVRYVTGKDWPFPKERIPNGSDHRFTVEGETITLEVFNGREPAHPVRSVAPIGLSQNLSS